MKNTVNRLILDRGSCEKLQKVKVCRPGFHNSRYLSQWIECLKSSYVVCKAKWSRIESLLSCKYFSSDSSLFCLMFQCHIVICHPSTMTLEHMQRIWGWLRLEKCFFIPHEFADKENTRTSESWGTFHWSWTNFQLLLCDTCEIIISSIKKRYLSN